MTKKKRILKTLIDNDYSSFKETLNEKLADKIEKLAWSYYHQIEDELKEKMSKYNKDSSTEE